MPREIKVAQLENCLAGDALKTLEGFDFPTGEGERTVQEIMMPIEQRRSHDFCLGGAPGRCHPVHLT